MFHKSEGRGMAEAVLVDQVLWEAVLVDLVLWDMAG